MGADGDDGAARRRREAEEGLARGAKRARPDEHERFGAAFGGDGRAAQRQPMLRRVG